MTTTTGVLALLTDQVLRDDVDRVAAAAGVPVVHAAEPSSRQVWSAAGAVLVDATTARLCAACRMPRRGRVVLVARAEPDDTVWQAAIAVGAQEVFTLPHRDAELVAALSDATESAADPGGRGRSVAVVGGRGGAGASVFAVALALTAADALLIDADPWSGGLDLVLGAENRSGVRWPDLSLRTGRLSSSALREALPRHHDVSVLTGGRSPADIDAPALAAVLDAGGRGGATVVCDLPRRGGVLAETALDAVDLVVVTTTADVRSCAATTAVAAWARAVNPNAGLVVRGPSPGGLRAAEVARAVGLPLLAAMRPQPRLADALEHGGLRLTRRCPLSVAARQVLTTVQQRSAAVAA
jgi:secretion/DNA translocation related CpaE-like protein